MTKPAHTPGPKLSDAEEKVLRAFNNHPEDCGLTFKRIAEKGGLPLDRVRRHVRAVARKGLLEHTQFYDDDRGFCGSGYFLTAAGRAALAALAHAEGC